MKRIFSCICLLLLFSGTAFPGDLAQFFPEKVSGLSRVRLVTGPEAQRFVDELHGKPLVAEESAVALYARPKERSAEVWLSRVVDEREARRQIGLMVHKMYENPKSPFKDPARLDHAGLAVYRFTGMGQVHLIWACGDLVWWVSANPGDESLFLDALCR